MRNDKAAALVHLSMKRSNEKLRSQLSVSLMQLEEARLALERCDINGLIVNTYREAARGLKAARMGGDLTVETAEEAMDLLQEEVARTRLDASYCYLLGLMHALNRSFPSRITRWTS